MAQLILIWKYRAEGILQGGNLTNPPWSLVDELTSKILEIGGSLTLMILDGPICGPVELQVLAYRHNYFLALSGNDAVDDFTRTLNRKIPRITDKHVDILGDLFCGSDVTNDQQLVKKAFRQFFDNGDVDTDILDD